MKYKLPGHYNLYNLLAALTVSEFFNLDMKKVKKVVENLKPVEDRGTVKKYKNLTIYFDAYNANPSSVKTLLDFINSLDFERKVAVLGDMMELGKKAMKHHTEVLHYAENFNFDSIFLFGNFYNRVYKERITHKKFFKPFRKLDDIAKVLKQISHEPKNTLVCIKGSRKMEMEKLLKLLKVR